MRNPASLYDPSITKEEPLRSFLYRPAPTGSERNELAQELSKKHLQAVKTWLELSFPTADAPTGEPIPADHTSAILFIRFYESLHTKGQPGARKYLDKEKANRKWPRTTAERNKNSLLSKHSGTKNDATERRKPTVPDGKIIAREAHSKLASKPVNLTSHVTAPNYNNPRFPRKSDAKSVINTVSDINTRGTKYNNPHTVHAYTTPAHSQSAISAMMAEVSHTIPQKRPSSSLSERKPKRRVTSDTQATEVKGTRGDLSTHDPKGSLPPTSKVGRNGPGKTTSSLNQAQRFGLKNNSMRRSSCLQDGATKEPRTSTGAPQSMSTQESGILKRKENPMSLSGQGSSQAEAITNVSEEAVDGTMKRYLKTGRSIRPRQRAKHSGTSTKSVLVADAKGVDFKKDPVELPSVIHNPKKMKGPASVQTRPQSALEEGAKLRKLPRNDKILAKASTTVDPPLSSSGTEYSPATGSPANNLRSRKAIDSASGPLAKPTTIGSPATNLRSRKNNETVSRASEKPALLKRKRAQSLDTNTKSVRMKFDISAQSSKSKASINSDADGCVTGGTASTSKISRRQVVNKGSANPKVLRMKANSSVQKPSIALPAAGVSRKPMSGIKKTRAQLSKKVSEVTSASYLPIKVEGTMSSLDDTSVSLAAATTAIPRENALGLQAKKKNSGLARRHSLRIKNLDLESQTHAEYEVNPDTKLEMDVVPAIEEIEQQPPYEKSAVLQADIVANLPETTIPTVATEHTTIGTLGYVTSPPESIDATMKPIFAGLRSPDTLFSPPSANDSSTVAVNNIEEEFPDFSQILSSLKCSPVLPPQNRENDEDIAMVLYDETNPSAEDLDHLDAEDVAELQYPDDHLDTLCRFPKSPLRFLPPLWAESRQEICESFDWFRSYQGGVYHAHNVAKGYLLGAFPSSRDRFEHGGRLIISHGGGKAESIHSKQGHLSSQPATDQLAQDKSVRALMNNYQNNRPLALLMDDRYALFPYDLKAQNVAYAVLGFYTISDAWAEYQPSNNESGRVVRYKFAFRWCDQQGSPWWEGKNNENVSLHVRDTESSSDSCTTTVVSSECSPSPDIGLDLEYVSTVAGEKEPFRQVENSFVSRREQTKHACSSCSRVFLQIFDLCWTCLNPECLKFCKRPNGHYLPDRLEYSSTFLELVPSKPIPTGFGSLKPASVLSLPLKSGTTYAFTRGFHCDFCGRLSCRYQWEQWECRNCKHSVNASYPPCEATTLMYQTPSTTFKDHSLNAISEITQLPPKSYRHEQGRGMVQTFVLPHNSAMIHHIQPGNALGRKEADSIFLDYQTQATSGALKFRRWPMRAHKCRGSLLTNYFSQNSGAPYKYVGGDANTVPFESAPGAVVRARDLIQKRIMQALNIPAQFNEVLSAAYMERQKMAFHSDNETGLGPLVAGLSLGSPALMHFRLHAKHDPEREKRGILLSIVLRHGDILVMDGAAVQDYYEHTVVPTNFRIAATARQINAEHA